MALPCKKSYLKTKTWTFYQAFQAVSKCN